MMQGKDFASFAADLQAFSKKIDVDFELALKKIIFECHARIVMRSPVDTGRFRASWTVNEGTPLESVAVEGTYAAPNDTAKKPGPVGNSQMLPAGVNVPVVVLKSPYTIVWINNSLPYAEPLEFGHSQQAPGGMVRLTAAEMSNWITNVSRRGL